MFCPMCGRKNADTSKFCEGCGASLAAPVTPKVEAAPAVEPAVEPVIEPAVKPVVEPAAEFVSAPTTVLSSAEPTVPMAAPAVAVVEPEAEVPLTAFPEEPVAKPKKKRKVWKWILGIGLPLIALLAAAAIVATMVFGIDLLGFFRGARKQASFVLYLKDGELHYNPAGKAEPFQLSEKLKADDEDADSYFIYDYVQASTDGKTMFFPQNIDWHVDEEYGWSSLQSFTLCYRKVGDKDDPVKIADDVTGYCINEKGTVVYYTDTDDTLYRHDLKEKEKIASDVDWIGVPSRDGKAIVFYTSDEKTELMDIYYWANGKDEKLASDVSNMYALTEDLKTIWYTDGDGTLYKRELGKDKVKIADDVNYVGRVYKSGEILYTKKGEEVKLSDYFEDDMAIADSAITEPVLPVEPTAPNISNYYTYEAYQAAYEAYAAKFELYRQQYTDYQTKSQQYTAKLAREELRLEIRDAILQDMTLEEICYYDGKKEIVLTTTGAYFGAVATDAAVGVYGVYDLSETVNFKMSEIEDLYDAEIAVRDSLNGTESFAVVAEGTVSTLDVEDLGEVVFSEDGKTMAYLCNADDEERYDLYKAEIKDTVKNAKKVDDEVDEWSLYLRGEHLMYEKDRDYGEMTGLRFGDLYMDGEKIDKEVVDWEYCEANDTIVYTTGYDEDEDTYTLKRYAKGSTSKIASDVFKNQVLPNGNVTYITDYDEEKGEGDLHLFTGKESVSVDKDVQDLVYVQDFWMTMDDYLL